MQIIRVNLTTEYIKLDQLLKFSGVTDTGGNAKLLVESGECSVNGVKCLQRGKKIRVGDIVNVEDKEIHIVE